MIRLDIMEARAELYSLAWFTRDFAAYVRHHNLDIEQVAGFAGGHGIIDVVDCGAGRFDWTAPGDPFPAFVCEAYAEDGETTIDLVAWPISRPGTVLSMFGNAAWLGAWAAWNPASYCFGKALTIHKTPLDWLKSGCTGAAVVNPRLAARELIDLPGPIAAQDKQHGRELLAMAQALVNRNRILVPTERRAA